MLTTSIAGASAPDKGLSQIVPGHAPATVHRPNIVVIVLDDVGFSDIGAFGSEIRTPNIDALARDGIRYNRFETRAICSSTRASLLTGRNNQTVRMEDLVSNRATPDPANEGADKGELPTNAETLAAALRSSGYTTSPIGKWHLAPAYDEIAGQDKRSWPLQRGFDHYYGYLSGWTDQYHPKLVKDNNHIATPEQEGYSLSVDLASRAIDQWEDDRVKFRNKPRFLYLAFGAAHSPIQVPRNYSDSYRGRYDAGWDVLRLERFGREQAMGIIPANTKLPPRNVGDRAWGDLDPVRQRVFARFMEVYAGFLTQADEQIGRVIEHLKQTGDYNNTLIVLISDNGAASEGGQDGAFWEHYTKPGTVEEMAANLELLGGPKTHSLYQRPWAMAGVTPFRRYKLWPYSGGVRTPMIMSWPARIAARGAVRSQPVDVIDLAPTIVAAADTSFHDSIDGVRQIPIAGRSIAATWNSATAQTRPIQFFSLRGNRAIRQGKWRAVAMHKLGTSYDQDPWQLFDTLVDTAEANDLSKRFPAKLAELKRLWWSEATRFSNPPLVEDKPSLYKLNGIGDAFSDPGD